MNKELFKQKTVAFLAHLALSILILASALLIAWRFWYPGVLFDVDGGFQGLEIVLMVDIVLGPVLTFVVFRRHKKGLGFDLSLIALMQIAALSWGLYQVYSERPVLMVLFEDTFVTFNAQAMDLNDIPLDVLDKFPGKGMKLVFASVRPKKYKSIDEISRELLTQGYYHTRYKSYIPLKSPEGRRYLLKYGHDATEDIVQPIPETIKTSDTLKLYHLRGKYKSGFVLMDIDQLKLKRFWSY